MIAYWIAFLIPVTAVLSPFRATSHFRRTIWIAIGLYFTVFVGLRHEVGADWLNYLAQFSDMAEGNLQWSEPGYASLNWAMAKAGLDIHAVNLVCGAIFVAGLLYFCRQEKFPWLAVAVAIPYLVIVVAMGYTKQAVSLGLLLWGLVRLQRGELKTFTAAMLLATMFHATALICLLFAALSARRMSLRLPLVAITLLVSVALGFLAQRLEALYSRFAVASDLQSAGAAVRLAMSVLAFAALLVFRKRWRKEYGPIELWAWMGALSVVCLALVPFASTAVDRVGLYFSPLQLVVWARVPTLVRGIVPRTLVVLAILCGYAAVLAVWLNLGNNAQTWIPYQNVLLDWVFN